MNGSLPVPGEYSFTELGDAFRVSRKTAEAYKDRFKLQYTEVMRNNRPVHGVILTEEDINIIITSTTPSMPKFSVPEGRVEPSEGVVESRRMVEEEVLEGYRNRIEEIQTENSHLKESIDSFRSENMEEKIKSAKLEKDVEKLEALNSQFDIRLREKDQIIETLRAHIESEKSRADSFNNQIRGLNDKLQTTRNSTSNEDIERWMQAAYEKQKHEISQMLTQKLQIEVNETPKSNEKKGVRFFGIEISRASNRWEGSMPRQRSNTQRRGPKHYQ